MSKYIKLILLLSICFMFVTSISNSQTNSSSTSNELSWMVGHWEGEAFGGTCEEDWQPMTAGTMCGTFKLIVDGKVAFYELMIISKTDSGYSLNLKHFNPDMTGWEEKDKVISFPFESVKENFIQFGGTTYERVSEDKLQIIVDVGHSEGKSEKVVIDCVKK